MAYIGNNLKVAYPTYEKIDDISASFNGVTTSFALLVRGSAPSPLPLNSQQCLISVGGAIQKPDDTGAEGFRLSGGNIVFSSAPIAGESFFGVILAGADYINAGGTFPDGSITVPSITFSSDTDTGIYRSGSGGIGFTSNGVRVGTLPSGPGTSGQYLRTDGAGTLTWSTVSTTFADGSSGTPSITFTNDTDTGIYRAGSGLIGFTSNGTNIGTLPTTAGSANQVLATDGAGTLSFVDRGRLVLETAKPSTSGTSIEFTSIPSWAKRITVIFSQVSTSGVSDPFQLQVGTSSGYVTSGYASTAIISGGSVLTSTVGLLLLNTLVNTYLYSGTYTICNVTGNTWIGMGSIIQCSAGTGGSAQSGPATGQIVLGATLDRLRIIASLTGSPSATFDAGNINILYEG